MTRAFLDLAAEAIGYRPEVDDTDSDLLLVISLRLL